MVHEYKGHNYICHNYIQGLGRVTGGTTSRPGSSTDSGGCHSARRCAVPSASLSASAIRFPMVGIGRRPSDRHATAAGRSRGLFARCPAFFFVTCLFTCLETMPMAPEQRRWQLLLDTCCSTHAARLLGCSGACCFGALGRLDRLSLVAIPSYFRCGPHLCVGLASEHRRLSGCPPRHPDGSCSPRQTSILCAHPRPRGLYWHACTHGRPWTLVSRSSVDTCLWALLASWHMRDCVRVRV